MTKTAGVTQEKARFRKGRVCSSFGLFQFCKVMFRDPPKIPFKTCIQLRFPGLCRKVVFALQGKKVNNNPKRFLGQDARFRHDRESLANGNLSFDENGQK